MTKIIVVTVTVIIKSLDLIELKKYLNNVLMSIRHNTIYCFE